MMPSIKFYQIKLMSTCSLLYYAWQTMSKYMRCFTWNILLQIKRKIYEPTHNHYAAVSKKDLCLQNLIEETEAMNASTKTSKEMRAITIWNKKRFLFWECVIYEHIQFSTFRFISENMRAEFYVITVMETNNKNIIK